MSYHHTTILKPNHANLEKYEIMEHQLDKCINDGTMWRASVDPSALVGSFVECFIPLDEDNYEDGALIPNYYKWVYDRYIDSESALKGLVAASLLEAAESRGLNIQYSNEAMPEEIIRQFDSLMIFLLDPDEDKNGHVKITCSKDNKHFEVIVSIDPLGVFIGGELITPK